MKKKVLSVLISLAMVLTFAPTVANADTHKLTLDDKEIEFTAWDGTTSLPTTKGNYYLMNDVTLSKTWSAPSGITYLDLNGHVIEQTGGCRVMNIGSSSQLYLCDYDSSKPHSGYVDSTGLWHFGAGEGTSVTVNGGIITGGKIVNTSGYGAGVCIDGGSLIMFGGSIVGNYAHTPPSGAPCMGAGVSINNSGTFILNDGAISYNVHDNYWAGGLYTTAGTHFVMNGGRINNNSGCPVGGIVLYTNDAKFNGGLVDNNISTSTSKSYPGGVCVSADGAIMGGSVQICNNKSTYLTGQDADVYLEYNSSNYDTFRVAVGTGTDENGNGVEKPSSSMRVGVYRYNTKPTGPITADGAAGSGDEDYFFSNNNSLKIVFDSQNNRLQIVKKDLLASNLNYLHFTASDGDVTVQLIRRGEEATELTPVAIQCSSDRVNWQNVSIGTSLEGETPTGGMSYTIPSGTTLYFAAGSDGENGTNKSFSVNSNKSYVFKLSGSGKATVAGNIMSLLDSKCNQTTLPDAVFSYLFSGWDYYSKKIDQPNECLIDASSLILPADELSESCYDHMFAYCTNLTGVPALPAETLAVCCYQSMFYKCYSLMDAPELPAANLANCCYSNMFEGCTSLKTAPELPATKLADFCYYDMFSDCATLNSVKVHFTEWNEFEYTTWDWLFDVASSGTFYCPVGLDVTEKSAARVPQGWNVEYIGQTASSGYYISFSGDRLTLCGTNLPDSFEIKPEKSALDYRTVTIGGGFEYGCDLYEIKFTVGVKEYTMHANCKTVDAATTVDTEVLDTLLAKVETYDNDYPTGSTSRIVTSKTTVTEDPICDASLHTSMFAIKNSIEDEKNSYTDQMDVDQKTIEFQTAVSAFENSLDAQLVVLSGSSIVKGDYSSSVEYTGVRYAEGIVLASNCNEKTFDDLKNLSAGFYTVVVDAKIYGFPVTKTYYVAVGTAAETNAESRVAEELARITPSPSQQPGGDDNPTVIPSVLDEGRQISAFVDISPAENGKISIVPEAGVKVERIAISTSNESYMPLKKVDTSIDAIVNGTNYVKVLLRTGNDTKAFTTSVSISCNTPAVAAYSGAVGVYSRGTNPAYIAYVKGDAYESLEDALTAELSGDTTVYYVKDGATLDKTSFSGTYTFFFGDSKPVVVTF